MTKKQLNMTLKLKHYRQIRGIRCSKGHTARAMSRLFLDQTLQ